MALISDIAQLMEPMMTRYRDEYSRIMVSDIGIINDMCRHLDKRKGKQLRPLLAMLVANCFRANDPSAPSDLFYKVVAALEILHDSTLIHDDVIDHSNTRRGIATINSLMNNKVAVLMGDYMLALVMKTINETHNDQLTTLVNNTALMMSKGELLQQQCCGHYDIEPETCLKIAGMKTACFMSLCCEVGAIFSTGNSEGWRHASLFGHNLGMAFQLRDDMHDFLPESVTGKPQGNDIQEHKATLPLINTLLFMSDSQKKNKLLSLINKPNPTTYDIESISTIVLHSKGWNETLCQMQLFLDEAHQHLDFLPNNQYRLQLHNLVTFLKEN